MFTTNVIRMKTGIDFSEPIMQVIERLLQEHKDLYPILDSIDNECKENPHGAVKMMKDVKPRILRHSVEEEARVIKLIMQNAKAESGESVEIMQEHRWVVEFLERRLDSLSNLNPSQISKEITQFDKDLKEHFHEEEQVVYPLALKLINKK